MYSVLSARGHLAQQQKVRFADDSATHIMAGARMALIDLLAFDRDLCAAILRDLFHPGPREILLDYLEAQIVVVRSPRRGRSKRNSGVTELCVVDIHGFYKSVLVSVPQSVRGSQHDETKYPLCINVCDAVAYGDKTVRSAILDQNGTLQLDLLDKTSAPSSCALTLSSKFAGGQRRCRVCHAKELAIVSYELGSSSVVWEVFKLDSPDLHGKQRSDLVLKLLLKHASPALAVPLPHQTGAFLIEGTDHVFCCTIKQLAGGSWNADLTRFDLQPRAESGWHTASSQFRSLYAIHVLERKEDTRLLLVVAHPESKTVRQYDLTPQIKALPKSTASQLPFVMDDNWCSVAQLTSAFTSQHPTLMPLLRELEF
jgi:hypothetical protein